MKAPGQRQRGSTLVEFAIVVGILLLLVIGAIEFGRLVFQWNAAVDATRRGARTAAIVAMNDTTAIREAMLLASSGLDDATVTVEYSPDGNFPGSCTGRGSCRFVRVSLSYSFEPILLWAKVPMPSFATTAAVEALGAT